MSQNVTVTPEEINALLDGLFDYNPAETSPDQVNPVAADPVPVANTRDEKSDWLDPVHAPAGREM